MRAAACRRGAFSDPVVVRDGRVAGTVVAFYRRSGVKPMSAPARALTQPGWRGIIFG